MRTRYRQVIHVVTTIFLTCFVSCLGAEDIIKKLPFCNPHTQEDSRLSDLVIISSLDGRITAFSTDNGQKAWDFETQPLLSSNLHHVELTSGGKWVRLVPSLRGTLYSLSGDSIEPLPFDAEQLLTSSFKYSDELVIAGARETRWVGVDARTGLIVYECNSSGCNSEQQTATAGRDILVLRRHSNTVRALDPRSGTEKWNFSVSDHQMALSRRECAGAYPTQSAVAIAVALPEGVVAVKGADNTPLWQQKLDSPVAGMWRLQGGVLQHMDVMWEAARALSPNSATDALPGPSLYLGVHDTQLYIQESQLYAKKLESSMSMKSLPWKLKQTRPLITDEGTALSLQDADPKTLTAVAIHGSAAAKENSGFFLYLQDTCDQDIQVDSEMDDTVLPNNSDFDATDFNHVHIHVYSLWFWWKEVLVIAVSSALVMNLMIWPRFFPTRPPPTTPLPVKQEYVVMAGAVNIHKPPVPVNNNTEYLGRFDTDFEPLMCLGKGGFGVVFKAKNKIDHCLYAVKRITLPRTESKRQRVLREVLALATLEHEHIVRYFNSWIEEPPPQWQETWDKHWMQKLGDISELPDDYTSPTRTRPSARSASVMIDPCMDVMEFDQKRSRSLSCNDSFIIEFDEKASKIASQTVESTKSPGDITPPNILSKHMASGDNDDSFIVFQKTTDEQTKDLSNKILDKVKDSDSFVKSDSPSKNSSKKKGHKRHWSLDMCLPANSSKMYLYIQMQLCQSDSLHDWLRKNHQWEMRRSQVKTLFSQIVSAVEYVHRKGLIHRDLKPSNIFFAQDGRVKVGDFGLVTAMADNLQDESDSNSRTRHTSRVGTHLYMSPEQLAGRAYNYKVDIYSLGMVLFELLCPFGTDAERVASLTRLRAGAFPTQFPETHPDETEVLKLMLNSDPNERPTATGVKTRAPLYERTAEGHTYEQFVIDNSK